MKNNRGFMKSFVALVLALCLLAGSTSYAAGGELLYKFGFIKGTSAEKLSLDEGRMLTREELAVIITQINGSFDEAQKYGGNVSFADAGIISRYAMPFVSYVVDNKLMLGVGGGKFDPKGEVTEKQLGTVLLRALGYDYAWGEIGLELAKLGFNSSDKAINRGEAFDYIWEAVTRPIASDGSTLGIKLGKLTDADIKSAEKLYNVDLAKKFQIQYLSEKVKLVTDSLGKKFLLVPDGVEVPEGFDGAAVIRTPIKKALVACTTNMGFILGLNSGNISSVAAVTTEMENWTTKEVVDAMKSGAVKYIAKNFGTPMNVEEIITIKPDVVFVDGSDFDSDVKLAEQLAAFGIPVVTVQEYLEKNPVGLIEWYKFFGAFYNMDKEADAKFEALRDARAALLKKTAAMKEEDKISVAAGMVYFGTVYSSGADSAFASLSSKLGAKYVFAGMAGESIQPTLEEFVAKAKDADVLVYTSLPQYLGGVAGLVEALPQVKEFKAYKNNRIYIFDMGYYQNRANEVEYVEDLLYILHPELFKEHILRHYMHLDVTK